MRIASLFSGAGGLDLGLERAGHETILQCEIDPAARRVLEIRFPGRAIAIDVRDLARMPQDADVVAAGFPCQDLSQAGACAGIAGARSGLFFEVVRLVAASRPPWVLLENVPNALLLGRGAAWAAVVEALEELGYAWAYRVVDSRAFGVAHRRRRVFLLASRDCDPSGAIAAGDEPAVRDTREPDWTAACGFYWTEGLRGLGWAVDAVPTLKVGSGLGIPSSPAVATPLGHVLVPGIEDGEALQGMPRGWTETAVTVGARWRLVGNAVTVGAGAWAGRALSLAAAGGGLSDRAGDPVRPGRSWPSAAFGAPGQTPRALLVGEFPVRELRPPLLHFLGDGARPLSARAARGFLSRLARGGIRAPAGLVERVQALLV